MDLARWSEALVEEVESAVGVPMPAPDGHRVRIDVAAGGTSAVEAASAPAVSGSDTICQRLLIRGYAEADYTEAERRLCGLLVDAMVMVRQPPEARGGGRAVAPEWLAGGVAAGLHPAARKRNSEEVLRLWSAGRLGSLAELLRRAGEGGVSDEVAGYLVRWLRDLPASRPVLGGVLDLAAEGKPLTPEWLAGEVGATGGVSRVEELWDAGMLREQRVVYLVRGPAGAAPPLEALRSWLLIRAGDSDMPLGGGPNCALTFADLVGRRGEPWIAPFARNRAARLRLLAVGRNAAFREVAEAYACFLDAAAAGRRRATQERLLKEADRRLQALEGGSGRSEEGE
jgi:hypothetical protein